MASLKTKQNKSKTQDTPHPQILNIQFILIIYSFYLKMMSTGVPASFPFPQATGQKSLIASLHAEGLFCPGLGKPQMGLCVSALWPTVES